MELLQWFLKEILKQKVLKVAFSLFMGIVSFSAGWLFDFQGVQVDMKKMVIIASLSFSAALPLIILFVVTFCTCMAIFAILRRVLPSQRFASDAKKILATLNLVRKYLDSRQTSEPFLVFQSIQNLKDTVFEKHGISYPSTDLADENYFVIWFGVLSDLHGLAVNAELKKAQHMPYDRL